MQNYGTWVVLKTQSINKQDNQEHSTIFAINYTKWSSKQYNIIMKLTAEKSMCQTPTPPFDSHTISATCQVSNILNLISILWSRFKDLF